MTTLASALLGTDAQAPNWKPYHVLEAREKLDMLPEPERAEAVKLIDQPGIPPKDAISILANLATMGSKRRQKIFRLAESDDSRERSLALTVAAQVPPMPDPRSKLLRDVARTLTKAAEMFPDDPFSPQIEAIIPPVREVITALDAEYRERKDAADITVESQ